MMMQQICGPIRKYVVPLLKTALEACVERHMIGEGRGVDSLSFGTDAWSLPSRLFKEDLEKTPFAVLPKSGCVLRYGEFELRHHKVGDSEKDDIERSFPEGAAAVSQIHRDQLNLPFGGTFLDLQPQHHAVIAFMANSEDGLCAVYLTTIAETNNGRISKWEDVQQVWLRDGVDIDLPEEANYPEPEVSPTPRLTKVKKEKRDAGK